MHASFLASGAFTEDLAKVRAELNGIDRALAPAALDSLTGEIYASTPHVAAQAGASFAGTVGKRLSATRGEAPGTQLERGFGRGAIAWIDALGRDLDVDGSTGIASYEADASGFAMGADFAVGGNARIGVTGGVSRTQLQMADRTSRAEVDSAHIGLYGAMRTGRLFIDGQASYASHDIDVTRTLTISTSNRRAAEGRTDAEEVRGSIKLGADLGSASLTVRPFVGLRYSSVDQKGLREEGAADAGLIVDRSDYEAGTTSLGMDLGLTLPLGSMTLRPAAEFAVTHDFVQEGWVSRGRMIGGGTAFTVVGAEPGRTAGVANLGLTGRYGRLDFRVGYGVETRKRLNSHSVGAGLSFRF